MTQLAPADEAELAAIVAQSAAGKTPLAIEGGGTRSGLGRPMQTAESAAHLVRRGLHSDAHPDEDRNVRFRRDPRVHTDVRASPRPHETVAPFAAMRLDDCG